MVEPTAVQPTEEVAVAEPDGTGGLAAAGVAAEAPLAQISVLGVDGAIVFALETPLHITAGALKALVAEANGLRVSKISLALGEENMRDTRSLAAHGIEANAQAQVTLIIDPHDLETDKEALIALYNSTNGAGWRKKQGWLTDAPVGEWYGVTVEGERVVKIDLQNNNLRGLAFFCRIM